MKLWDCIPGFIFIWKWAYSIRFGFIRVWTKNPRNLIYGYWESSPLPKPPPSAITTVSKIYYQGIKLETWCKYHTTYTECTQGICYVPVDAQRNLSVYNTFIWNSGYHMDVLYRLKSGHVSTGIKIALLRNS